MCTVCTYKCKYAVFVCVICLCYNVCVYKCKYAVSVCVIRMCTLPYCIRTYMGTAYVCTRLQTYAYTRLRASIPHVPLRTHSIVREHICSKRTHPAVVHRRLRARMPRLPTLSCVPQNVFSCYRRVLLLERTLRCVPLLLIVCSYYRMCSLAIECVRVR